MTEAPSPAGPGWAPFRFRSYRFTDTADALFARFAGAVHADKESEGKARKLGIAAAILILVTIPAGVVSAVLRTRGDVLGDHAWILPLLTLAAGVLCVLGWLFFGARNVEDRKVQAASDLLRVLRVDVPATAPVHLSVDFRSYWWGRRTRWSGIWPFTRSRQYEHRWFSLRAPLADGGILQLAIVDRVGVKKKPKRKYTKVNVRIVPCLGVSLRLGKRYGPEVAANAATHLQGLSGKAPYPVGGLSGKGRVLAATFRTLGFQRLTTRYGTSDRGPQAGVEGEGLLKALMFLYRGVAAASRAAGAA